MRSYEVARTLFSFLAFCAWSIVVVGGLVALIGAGGGSRYGGAGAGLLAMVPGLSIGIAGLLLVAFVQIGRAAVDTAEYSQQMLKVARDQLDVSKQGLKLQSVVPQTFTATTQTESGQGPKSSFASPANKTSRQERTVGKLEPEQFVDQTTIYRGKTIRDQKGKFVCKGIPFDTLLAAKEHIDALATPLVRKLPGPIRET
jgi:hypothetical protein